MRTVKRAVGGRAGRADSIRTHRLLHSRCFPLCKTPPKLNLFSSISSLCSDIFSANPFSPSIQSLAVRFSLFLSSPSLLFSFILKTNLGGNWVFLMICRLPARIWTWIWAWICLYIECSWRSSLTRRCRPSATSAPTLSLSFRHPPPALPDSPLISLLLIITMAWMLRNPARRFLSSSWCLRSMRCVLFLIVHAIFPSLCFYYVCMVVCRPRNWFPGCVNLLSFFYFLFLIFFTSPSSSCVAVFTLSWVDLLVPMCIYFYQLFLFIILKVIVFIWRLHDTEELLAVLDFNIFLILYFPCYRIWNRLDFQCWKLLKWMKLVLMHVLDCECSNNKMIMHVKFSEMVDVHEVL